jgi:bacterioferritin-associated ferredoxin
MYVCICAGITQKEIEEIVTANTTLEHLQSQGICDDCCKCQSTIEDILEGICRENSIPILK